MVRAVILRRGQVLVAQAGHAFLPGGPIERGEPAEAALLRELREELAVEARVAAYLGAIELTYGNHHEIGHFFHVTADALACGGDPVSAEAHLRFHWAGVDDLGGLGVLPRPLQSLVPRWVRGDRRIGWASEIEGRPAPLTARDSRGAAVPRSGPCRPRGAPPGGCGR